MLKVRFGLILICLIIKTNLQGQHNLSISNEYEKIIHQAMDSIYNLKFEAAHQLIGTLENEIPYYPGLYLLKSYYLLWKHAPLKGNNPVYPEFIAMLDQTIITSKALLKEAENDPEAIFYSISAHAILTRLHIDNGNNFNALNEAKKGYNQLKAGFELTDQFADLNLICGIYNYYREKYPEENPIFRPFVWILRHGDKAEGIEMLKTGSDKGLFTQPECLSYLFFIYFRYEFLPSHALPYTKKLNDLYPNNTFYTSLLIENLIYMKNFNQVDSLLYHVENSDVIKYMYIGSIYRGLYEELYQNDLDVAMKAYLKALSIEEQNDVFTPHYASLLYLGLGRTNLSLGNDYEAKEFLKKSARISEYSFVRDEAKRLLDEM